MSKITKTSFAVLGMLATEPMTGYEIRRNMQQSTANFWAESDGQLYPALANLAKQGYIAQKKTAATNARAKKTYQITNQGKTQLKKWLATEYETQTSRNEFMLKLFFGGNVTPDITLEHVQRHRYQTKTALAKLNTIKKELENESQKSIHLPYWKMSVQYGIKIAAAKLIWCDEVIHELEKMRSSATC